MKSAQRLMLEKVLSKRIKEIKASIVVNIGAGVYTYKESFDFENYFCVDINKKMKPDACMDIYHLAFKSNCVDAIIMTEVLEHLSEPKKAVLEIRRVLKPHGICIASVPFIYPFHGEKDMGDYYRFTKDALSYLFKSFKSKEVIPYGSTLQTIWLLFAHNKRYLKPVNYIIQHLKLGKINSGFIIIAKK